MSKVVFQYWFKREIMNSIFVNKGTRKFNMLLEKNTCNS